MSVIAAVVTTIIPNTPPVATTIHKLPAVMAVHVAVTILASPQITVVVLGCSRGSVYSSRVALLSAEE